MTLVRPTSADGLSATAVLRILVLQDAGNHEIEADAFGQTFQAYTTRYPAPQPTGTGRINSGSNFYYSTDFAGVHTGERLRQSCTGLRQVDSRVGVMASAPKTLFTLRTLSACHRSVLSAHVIMFLCPVRFLTVAASDSHCRPAVFLTTYVDHHPGSAQYNWFIADMTTNLDRSVTPWVVVVSPLAVNAAVQIFLR